MSNVPPYPCLPTTHARALWPLYSRCLPCVGGCVAVSAFQLAAPLDIQNRRPCCSTVCGYPVGSDLYDQHVFACSLSTAARFLSAALDLESAPTVLSYRHEVAALLEITLEAGTRGSDADVLQHRHWLLAQLATALQSAHSSRLLCWMRNRVLKQTPSSKSPVRLAIRCSNR